jgi:hypothetical protein
MNSQTKENIIFAYVIILSYIIFTTFINGITATDWIYRHSEWISRYLKGDFSPIQEYPPLFHFIMLPFVALQFPVKYFQILFIFLSTSSLFYFAYKKEDEKVLRDFSILVVGALPFIMFSGALMPQAFDYILFPLICLAYFKNKYATAIIGLLTIFFMHEVGIIFMGILFLHSLLTRRKKFALYLLITIILILPIFYYYEFESLQNLKYEWDIKAQNEWESQFINPIWKFFALSGLFTWIYLPKALLNLKKIKFKLSEIHILYLIWIIGFLPLGIFDYGIWRMMSYIIVPLSLFVTSLVSDK